MIKLISVKKLLDIVAIENMQHFKRKINDQKVKKKTFETFEKVENQYSFNNSLKTSTTGTNADKVIKKTPTCHKNAICKKLNPRKPLNKPQKFGVNDNEKKNQDRPISDLILDGGLTY